MKDKVEKKVYAFKTKYDEGFTNDEIDKLLKSFPEVSRERLSEAIGVVTCMTKEGQTIIFRRDIAMALSCCVENRDMHWYEFD